MSNTATPVSKRGPMRRRVAAAGASARNGRGASPRGNGRPSNGRPIGSTIRPIQLSSGEIAVAPIRSTISPMAKPSADPSGRTVAPSRERRRISPPIGAELPRIKTRSPRLAARSNPTTRKVPRPSSTTRPIRVASGISRISDNKFANISFIRFPFCSPLTLSKGITLKP